MNFNFSVILGLVCSIGNLQLIQGKYYTFHLKNSGKTQGKIISNLYEPCNGHEVNSVLYGYFLLHL